jgi:protein-S-isoprenylcysteine O-methyltransferase Ste14
MPLKEEIERQGNWMFRWRSYLPLVLLPVAAWAFVDAGFARQSPGPWDLVCVAVSFLGLAVRVLVAGFVPAGTSGRNVAKQEAYALNQTGIYSTVRHPLYLGNFLMALGIVLFLRSPWFSLVFALLYWMYYERIMFVEEEFLRRKYRSRYERWAEKTPAIIPSLARYAPPALPFSLRTVLRREYPGVFGLAFSFTFLAILRGFLSGVDQRSLAGWVFFLGAAMIVYGVLRTMKHAGHLSVPGR